MKKIFALRLKDLRISYGLSMAELAAAVGLKTKSGINQLEKEVSFPTVERLIAIADFFFVTIDYLVGRSEEKYNEKYISDIENKMIKQVYISRLLPSEYKDGKKRQSLLNLDIRVQILFLLRELAINEERKKKIYNANMDKLDGPQNFSIRNSVLAKLGMKKFQKPVIANELLAGSDEEDLKANECWKQLIDIFQQYFV